MSKRILILLLMISLVILTFCTKKSTEPEEQLLPPTNLTISLVENNKIQINWVGNSTKETAYFIDRKMGTYIWLENFGEVTSNITSLTDNIPTDSDTVFSYRIRAFDDENYSAYSDTLAWFSNNSAPSGLQVEQITQDTLKLTWQDNSIGEQYFRIDRKIDEKGWQTDYAHVPADTTHFVDYTTALYDTCNYKVFAVTGISHSDSTENAFIPFLPAPSNLQLQALGATGVKLTWQDNCYNEEGYRLFIKRGETAVWDSLNLPENIEEYTDENVIPGIINYYKICAYYENDKSGYVEKEINTLPAPNNLICAQLNVHTFELNWNDNSQFEQGFKMDRKIDEEDWINNIHTSPPNVTSWIDSTIGRNYNTVYYRLQAYYENYNSDVIEINSNISFPAPSDLDYEILSTNSIQLNWVDNSNGEDGFRIERKVYEGTWNELASVYANDTSYTDSSVNEDDTFHYRVYAYVGENCSDYSNEISYGTVTDIDGNVYQTILIGDQEWMMENLKVTHYRNGEPISNLTNNNDWTNTTSGAYCYYNNDPDNADTYGALYNWYAVDDSRNIAPTGWHVPTDDDWQELIDYLGGSGVAGGKMKETGTTHWNIPNTGATNESGFTALPGGCRGSSLGNFSNIGDSAFFWSSTESNSNGAWDRLLYYHYSGVNRYNNSKNYGFSIRCLRD